MGRRRGLGGGLRAKAPVRPRRAGQPEASPGLQGRTTSRVGGNVDDEAWGRAAGDDRERAYSWLDGSGPRSLSADGRTLLFYEDSAGSGPVESVFLRRLDGSEPMRPGPGWPFGLSPDGRLALAATSPRRDSLLLIPTGAGETTVLPRGAIARYHWASFFPDGRRALVVGNEAGKPLRLWVQELPKGQPTPVGTRGTEDAGAKRLRVAAGELDRCYAGGPTARQYLCR